MPQNPATLIWVQVTQIFKYREKHSDYISENGRQRFLLHCAVLFWVCFGFFWFLFFTAVARGSAVRSQTSTSDGQKKKKKSTQPVTDADASSSSTSSSPPDISVFKHQPGAIHPPPSRVVSSWSCPAAAAAVVHHSCLQVAIQAFFTGAESLSCHRLCCWLDEWMNE